jgi:hypothetical protein
MENGGTNPNREPVRPERGEFKVVEGFQGGTCTCHYCGRKFASYKVRDTATGEIVAHEKTACKRCSGVVRNRYS